VAGRNLSAADQNVRKFGSDNLAELFGEFPFFEGEEQMNYFGFFLTLYLKVSFLIKYLFKLYRSYDLCHHKKETILLNTLLKQNVWAERKYINKFK